MPSEIILIAAVTVDGFIARHSNEITKWTEDLPLFKKQIKSGGPVTVTDKRVIRYFMTISEATELVIQAGSLSKGGDVFLLEMGEPIGILDLAKEMIELSGKEIKDKNNLSGDIEIKFTGLRDGGIGSATGFLPALSICSGVGA